MSSFRYGVFLTAALLLITACSKVYHLASEKGQSYRISENSRDDSPVSPLEGMIAPYRQKLSAEMNEVIGLASSDLDKGPGESTLGNWVADAVLAQAKMLARKDFDFAICNIGGLRIPGIPAGPITRGQMYELMPFDNYLVTMQLPGEVIASLFDRMAAQGGWPISEGVSYQISDKKATQVMIKGKPIDSDAIYEIVLSDYLAEGGSDLEFLRDYPYENLDIYYRDAMIEFALLNHAISRSLDARIEGRIIVLDQ